MKRNEYNNIMDQAEVYLCSRRGEASSIISSVGSKVERLQLDEMPNIEMKQKKAACAQKVKKLKMAKAALGT